MKTHLAKRMLSLVLSILMVVTMLPTFALTASAATEEYSYLVSNITDGISANNDVTWDGTKGAAYFDGDDSLTISGTPLSNISASTGFTISMDVAYESGTRDSRVFEMNGGGNGWFTIHGYKGNWWERYMCGASNGSNERTYYLGDGTERSKGCVYANGYVNDKGIQTASTFHNITYVLDTEGYFYVFVDGVLNNKFKNNYNNSGASGAGNLTDAQFIAAIKSFTGYYIGGSNSSGSYGFRGWIKNLKFYNTVSPMVADTNWELVSSTDFTAATGWSSWTTTDYLDSTDGSVNTMKWYGGSVSNGFNATATGVKIGDGYVCLQGYHDASGNHTSGTPITGLSSFKADIEFEFFEDSVVDGDDPHAFCLFKILDNVGYDDRTGYGDYHFFGQGGRGYYCVQGNSSNPNATLVNNTDSVTKLATDHYLGTNNSYIAAKSTYHYIMEYTGSFVHAYVTDAKGVLVLDLGTTYVSGKSTANISGIRIGDDNDDRFYRNLNLKSFKLYGPATSSTASLRKLVSNYETAMQSGKVLTNMTPAYLAYIDACEVLDAIDYGKNNSVDVASAYTALNAALKNMEVWNPYLNSDRGLYKNSAADGTYYRHQMVGGDEITNVLFSYGLTGSSSSDMGVNSNSSLYRTQYGDVVFLYDGVNTPAVPINSITWKNSTGKRRFRGMWPNSATPFTLYHQWHGRSENVTYQTATDHTGSYSSTSDTNGEYTENDNSSTKYKYSNTLYYTSSLSDDTTNTSYTTIQWYLINNEGNTNTANATAGTLYVVNYKPFIATLTKASNVSKLASVTSCKEGELLSVVQAYDQATGYNPSDVFENSTSLNGSTVVTRISTCTSDLSTKATAVNNAVAAADVTAFESLRSYLSDGLSKSFGSLGTLTATEIFDNNAYNETNLANYGVTTAGSETQFYKAYKDARTFMAGISNVNSTNDYTANASTAATLATALYDAFDLLTSRSTAAVPTFSGETYLGPNDSMTITSTESAAKYSSGKVTYRIYYNVNNTDGTPDYTSVEADKIAYNSSGNIQLFNESVWRTKAGLSEQPTTAIVTAYGTDIDGNTDIQTSGTYRFLAAPSYTSTSASEDDELLGSDTVSISANTAGLATGLQYSYDNTNWRTYSTAFAPFTDNSTVSIVTIYMRQVSGTSTSAVTEFVVKKVVQDPGFSVPDGAYLGRSSTVSAVNNPANTESGEVTYEYHYDSAAFAAYTGPLQPFSSQTDESGKTSKDIWIRAVRNGKLSNAVKITVHYLSRPDVTIDNLGVMTPDDTVTVATTNDLTTGLQYSIDGGANWTDIANGGTFKPFTLNATASSLTVSVRQYSAYGDPAVYHYSPVLEETVVKKPTAPTVTVDGSGTHLDATHGVTATRNVDDHDDVAPTLYEYSTDSGAHWTTYTPGTKLLPFSSKEAGDETSSVTYLFRCSRTVSGVTVTSDPADATVTVQYLSRPTSTTSNGAALAADGTVTLASSCGLGTDGLKYRILDETDSDAVLLNWTNYSAPFAPFTLCATADKVKIEVKQESGASVSPVLTISNVRRQTVVPTVVSVNAPSTFLNKTTGFTITNNDVGTTTSTIYYKTSIGTSGVYTDEAAYTPGDEIKPFASYSESNTTPVYIQVRSEKHGVSSGWSDPVVLYYLNAPTINNRVTGSALVNLDELTGSESLQLHANNTSGGTLKYYINDGSGWDAGHTVAADTDFAPFALAGYTDDVTLQIKATQISGSCESVATDTFTLVRKVNVAQMFWRQDGTATTSTNSYAAGGTFFIDNTLDDYSGKTIYYQKTVDGNNYGGAFYSYNVNEGIDSDLFTSNDVVSFKFYIIENASKTVVAQASFTKQGVITNADDNMLIYHESFDDASVAGTTFTTGSAKGVNGTLINSGTAAVEASAGGEYDYRKNVLKINAPTLNTVGNYVQLGSNPLANAKNADLAHSNGITISFWRHMNEDGGAYNSAIGFTSYDSTHTDNRYKFAILTIDGKLSYAERGSNGTGGGYMNYYPHTCDITNHSVDAHQGYWTNIVLTVDPNKNTLDEAFMVYINGEPHEIKSDTLEAVVRSKNGDFSSMTDRQIIDAFMDFVTDSNTHFDYGYNAYNDNSDNLHTIWYDDLRIYTKVKTQVDINNMYTDTLSDSYQSGAKTSNSHDPDNVTVYKMKADFAYTTPGGAAKTTTLNQEVGQEFIDYYNVPTSQINSIEYYSFGTGLTVYKSTDNKNWIVLGDSKGRCGYQNEELFLKYDAENEEYVSAPYYETLSEPLTWSANDTTSDTRAGAAGHLVWAPHVVYNLQNDKWMYYGSTSSWNSGRSAIFVLSSNQVASGYQYQGMIVKTSNSQYNTTGTGSDTINAIDACVYYGHYTAADEASNPAHKEGAIDPSAVHLIYGSWHDIMHKNLNVDGTAADETNIGDKAISIAVGGGEGGFMVYNNGYYYYYISPGSNGNAGAGGAYHIRVYRSTSPDSGFVSIAGTRAMYNEPPHGNSFLTGYENTAAGDYVYSSTGHSSVYTAYNDDDEPVLVNAAHAREYTRGTAPSEDTALSTRQIWLIGNVAIHNPVVYTQNGWPVAFPMQYDNTFSTKYKGKNWRNWLDDPSFSAFDVEGTYAINDMLIEPGLPSGMNSSGLDASADTGFSTEKTYTIIAEDDTTGVFMNNETGTGNKFVIEPSADKSVTYMTLYEEDGTTPYAYGVFANQGTWNNDDTCKMEFSMITVRGTTDTMGGRGIWGVRTAKYPRDVVNAPEGKMVEMDEVVYTHKANNPYTMYGQEISDDIGYLDNTGDGERVTTMKVAYPYYIDSSDPNSIICLNDVEFMEHGYSTGNYSASAVRNTSGGYYYLADGTGISDTAFNNLEEEDKKECYRFYVLTGDVSDYFDYFNNTDDPFDDKGTTNVTGYPEHGLKLLIQYKNGDPNSAKYGSTYGEYKFPFVMPNPGEAHTFVGIRNNNSDAGVGSMKIGGSYFTRFNDSYGSVIKSEANRPSVSYGAYTGQTFRDNTSDDWETIDTGTFIYLHNFEKGGTSAYQTATSDNPANRTSFNYYAENSTEVQNLFKFYNSNEGINSGAYKASEHHTSAAQTYANGTYVVDADYYIDYSDESNSLITRNGSTPTGYALKFYSSNLKWSNNANVESGKFDRASSYINNQTGLSIATDSATTNNGVTTAGGISYTATSESNMLTANDASPTTDDAHQLLFDSDGDCSYTNLRNDLGSYNTAFGSGPNLRSVSHNGDWMGTIVLSGKNSVNKATEKNYGKSDSYNANGVAANFIYEQGTVFHYDINYVVTHPYWYHSLETYHYYNIGVNTCDKGAVRRFTDRWAYKEMNINGTDAIKTLTEEELRGTNETKGAINTIATKNVTVNGVTSEYINAANYTVESYNNYLDALAEAYWFVYNPKNTTYTKGGNTYEYTTAYGNVNGGYNQMIYHAETGDDIFHSGKTNVQTDEVQAKIIADVVIAYKNLFSISDYKEVKDNYDSIHFCTDYAGETDAARSTAVSDIHSILIKGATAEEDKLYTDTGYTADSWTNFITFIKSVVTDFDYYTNDADISEGGDHKGTDINEWRYVPLDGEQYEQLDSLIAVAKTSLMPTVDTTELRDIYNGDEHGKFTNGSTVVGTADGTVQGGIFTGGDQTYSYGSWAALKEKCQDAKDLLDGVAAETVSLTVTNDASPHTFNVGKYAPTNATKYTFGDEEDPITFYAQNFTENASLDSTHYKSGDALLNNCSEAQADVYDAFHAVDDTDLVDVDADSAYRTYDSANAVITALDMNKYTSNEDAENPGGVQLITSAIAAADSAVYTNADELAAYNSFMGTSLTGTLKKTGTDETDPQTASLLTVINTVNNTHVNPADDTSDYKYIKYFKATFTVQESDQDEAALETDEKVMYGDTVTFDIPVGLNSKPVVKWGVSVYNGEYDDPFGAKPVSSQTISGIQGASITRVVTSNMAIFAEVDSENGPGANKIQYNIQDCYGHIVDVKYVSDSQTLTVDENNQATVAEVTEKLGVTPKVLPFYSCSVWEVTTNSATLITLKPIYTTSKTFDYTFIGATTDGLNGVDYDSKVTVSFDTTEGTFAAWAVRTVGNKYQIVSYSQNYAFYACADETYVAIVNTGTDEAPVYMTTEDTPKEITQARIDGAITETGSIGGDAFVTKKIHDRLAFVSVQNLTMESTKVRLYVRITEGADEPTGYGILMRKDYTGTDENMLNGATGVNRREVSSRLSTGQFTYTLNKSAGFTSGDAVSFRAFVNYNFEYTAANQTATINALDYSGTVKVQKA